MILIDCCYLTRRLYQKFHRCQGIFSKKSVKINRMRYSSYNTGTSIPQVTGLNIYVTAAISGFSANGTNFPVSTSNQLYLANAPLLITGSITNAAAGTIFYYYDVNNNERP
jgi:hypothetical protein